ncbi:unnamed protein product [Dovyalis caffra]|uniref:Uncharacterized protein n=1 Tax=Dovyalis caffra TaxID=77055 RepID=A0AAV1SA51_9ROSI|nr:unnamed protein product [Dovyalis caffra]
MFDAHTVIDLSNASRSLDKKTITEEKVVLYSLSGKDQLFRVNDGTTAETLSSGSEPNLAKEYRGGKVDHQTC